MENNNNYFFPWVRKGIGSRINEKDTLGKADKGSEKCITRPTIRLSADMKASSVNKELTGTEQESIQFDKVFEIVGPGDVLNINTSAIKAYKPSIGQKGFTSEFAPYIEFWEPDFAWRFTPASPNENGRLRPWIALVFCATDKCKITKGSNNTTSVTFLIDDEKEFNHIFPYPHMVDYVAHAQGISSDKADFCRIVAMPGLWENMITGKEYTAFLVPTFEQGRLRGIGAKDEDVNTTDVQKSAWEISLASQKELHKKPLTFPVYSSWSFTAGGEKFETLVRKLQPAKDINDSIKIDVTKMGNGLDYEILNQVPERKEIDMPTAMMTLGRKNQTYPNPNDNAEKVIYDRMTSLLSNSPVFEENAKELNLIDSEDEDDPWIVPPVYGAKHIMATSLDEKNAEWLKQVNLDINYRIAAGLGKKVVQKYQEKLVNRAWQQVEYVNELNNSILNKSLAVKIDKSVKQRVFPFISNKKGKDQKKVLSQLMVKLPSMKKTKNKTGVSISSLMNENDIPQSFASSSFRNVTSNVSKINGNIDLDNITEKISNQLIFKNKVPEFGNYPSVETLKKATTIIRYNLLDYFCKRVFGKYQNITGGYEKFNIKPKISDFSTNKMIEYRDFIAARGCGEDAKEMYLMRGLNDSHCCGFTVSDYDKLSSQFPSYLEYNVLKLNNQWEYPNMIGLPRKDFEGLFGNENLFIHVHRDLYWDCKIDYYFFSIEGLIEAAEKNQDLAKHCRLYKTYIRQPNFRKEEFDHSRWNENYSHLSFEYDYYNMFDENGNRRELSPDSKLLLYLGNYKSYLKFKYYTADSCHSIDYYNNPSASFLKSLDTNPELKKKYIESGDEYVNARPATATQKIIADCLLNKPDFVVFDRKYLDNSGLVKELYNWDNHVKNLRNIKGLSEEWNCLFELEDIINSLSVAHETKSKSDTTKLSGLQDELLDTESYQRQKQAIELYTQTYISNKNLEEDFIKQLLATKHPIMAYPQFPEPTYQYLKGLSNEFVLPHVDEIPNNTISMFINNAAFIEAFLCGMNTEFGKELLWREYPTDQRGSYFRKFWDTEIDETSIINDKYFDVTHLHQWTGKLGENHMEAKGDLIQFVIKGELIKNYPGTRIYLNKVDKDLHRIKDEVILPSAQAFLKDDVCIVGFRAILKDVIGNPKSSNYGYVLVFEQDSVEIDFTINSLANEQSKVNEKLAVVNPVTYSKHVLNIALGCK